MLPSAVRLLEISSPMLTCWPDTVAPLSALTSATGILFT
ncbi:Uncharacterised protein [Mycobacteroides abscessus subsp. abscessus]|nr:Uncharacterised protein [Mycobacteroides abscessus subsp. abscessus]SKV56151.1 Uncharacterised protein [Mycobacteroides abscessus subsp. abscessus]SKW85171.1 Uncharacterised protein [Mycobacteroides abscessus subsp. abscessus]